MKDNKIEILIISIASITCWDMLRQMSLISTNLQRILWLISILFFLYAFISLLKDFEFENDFYKFILILFLIYQLIIVIRGFFLPQINLVQIFREPQNFLGFIIPLFVFFDKNPLFIIKLFKILFVLGILFLIIAISFPNLLLSRLYGEPLTFTFAVGCGFLLMNADYLSNRRVNISFIVILLSALLLIYLARRSSAFTYVGFLFFSYLINILYRSNKKLFRFFPLIIGVGIIIFIFSDKFSSTLTQRLSDRLYEDSRTHLFDTFFVEMDDFMVFGKGMNGTYFYPIQETEMEDGVIFSEVEYRNLIENGYFQLYLTGGVINVILFILLLIPAAYLGIFRSNNKFTRACGVMIFLWLLDMLLFGLPRFSIHYVIIWIFVGICFKKSYREKSESEIRSEFSKKSNESYTIDFTYQS